MGKLKESLLRLLVILICFGTFFAVFASYQYTVSLENSSVVSTTISVTLTDDRQSVSTEITIYGVVPETMVNTP